MVATIFAPVFAALSLGVLDEEPVDRPSAVVGEDYHGDGLGVNCTLKLTPKGRFQSAWHGCLGLYDQNEGTYLLEKGRVHLIPERPNRREGLRGTPTEFVAVRWGERMYLIPDGESWAREFCNAVSLGREPRDRPHGRPS